jgi:hypothetical protein
MQTSRTLLLKIKMPSDMMTFFSDMDWFISNSAQ